MVDTVADDQNRWIRCGQQSQPWHLPAYRASLPYGPVFSVDIPSVHPLSVRTRRGEQSRNSILAANVRTDLKLKFRFEFSLRDASSGHAAFADIETILSSLHTTPLTRSFEPHPISDRCQHAGWRSSAGVRRQSPSTMLDTTSSGWSNCRE